LKAEVINIKNYHILEKGKATAASILLRGYNFA